DMYMPPSPMAVVLPARRRRSGDVALLWCQGVSGFRLKSQASMTTGLTGRTQRASDRRGEGAQPVESALDQLTREVCRADLAGEGRGLAGPERGKVGGPLRLGARAQ